MHHLLPSLAHSFAARRCCASTPTAEVNESINGRFTVISLFTNFMNDRNNDWSLVGDQTAAYT
jgi:hypothetical protein